MTKKKRYNKEGEELFDFDAYYKEDCKMFRRATSSTDNSAYRSLGKSANRFERMLEPFRRARAIRSNKVRF